MPRKPKSDVKPFVVSLQRHQREMRILLMDSRLIGNRRLLAKLLSFWLDGDDKTRQFMLDLIRAQYIDGRGIRWKDDDDTNTGDPSKLDVDASKKIEDALEAVFGSKS